MTKAELVAAIADRADLTRVKADAALDGLIDTIKDALTQGDKITLTNFGSFSVSSRGPRKGRNPRTGQVIDIPSRASIRFSPGASLKKAVSGGDSSAS